MIKYGFHCEIQIKAHSAHLFCVSVEEIHNFSAFGHLETKISSTGLFQSHFYDDLCVNLMAQGDVSSHSCYLQHQYWSSIFMNFQFGKA